MGLIKAFCELPRKEKEEGDYPLNGERILFSVCTGSLFLATAGVLDAPNLKVTTHPVFYQNLREILTARKGEGEGDRVVKDRFVVNKVNEKGVRIVTCGGVTSGFHGALWLVGYVGGAEARRKVEEIVCFEGVEGLVL